MVAYTLTEKMMGNGPRKTRTDDKNSRSEWAASTFLSRYRNYHRRVYCKILTFRSDCQDWLPRRCHRIPRSRRTSCFLLSRPGPQGTRLLVDCIAFQDQANLNCLRILGAYMHGVRRLSLGQKGYHRRLIRYWVWEDHRGGIERLNLSYPVKQLNGTRYHDCG